MNLKSKLFKTPKMHNFSFQRILSKHTLFSCPSYNCKKIIFLYHFHPCLNKKMFIIGRKGGPKGEYSVITELKGKLYINKGRGCLVRGGEF